MILMWKARPVADIAGPLSEAEIDLYRTAGRIVRRRFRTVRRYLP